MGVVFGYQGEVRIVVVNWELQLVLIYIVGIGVIDYVVVEKVVLDSWVLVIGVVEEKGCVEEVECNGFFDWFVVEVEVDNVVFVQGKFVVEEEGEDSLLFGLGEENRIVLEESLGEVVYIVVENCEELQRIEVSLCIR